MPEPASDGAGFLGSRHLAARAVAGGGAEFMKAILQIELRDDNTVQMMRLWTGVVNECSAGLGNRTFGKWPSSGWCAEITGFDDRFGYAREFCRFKKDYSRANSKGSRGVYAIYCLDSDKLYEVKDRDRRYFCVVRDWKIVEVSKEQVDEWLSENSESTFCQQRASE
jgi:hypothetical protein